MWPFCNARCVLVRTDLHLYEYMVARVQVSPNYLALHASVCVTACVYLYEHVS